MTDQHPGDDEHGPLMLSVIINRDIADPDTGAKALVAGVTYRARVVLEGEQFVCFEVLSAQSTGPPLLIAVAPEEVRCIVNVDRTGEGLET
ncbi:MAG: hypothetical protein DRH08_00875 [Deltaproteobacteria bacterium]|nr:MAG: hypothetical protein DRH08_00875 [Deltaproteobacteria bacterium]